MRDDIFDEGELRVTAFRCEGVTAAAADEDRQPNHFSKGSTRGAIRVGAEFGVDEKLRWQRRERIADVYDRVGFTE